MRTIAGEGEGAIGVVGVIREGGRGEGLRCASVGVCVYCCRDFFFFFNPRLQVQLLGSYLHDVTPM